MDGKGDILQDEVPLNDEGLIWGCDFSCGFESPSFEEVARHEETCKIEPGDAGVVENVRHAQFALLVSSSCREDQPGRKVRSTSCGRISMHAQDARNAEGAGGGPGGWVRSPGGQGWTCGL